MKDKEVCPICSATTKHLWLFHLAKYNSLDPKARMRFNICDGCARKLMAAIKTAIRENERDLIRGDGRREVLLKCPICHKERATVEPKVPAPCEGCGTIFSVYSSGGMRIVKMKSASEIEYDDIDRSEMPEAEAEEGDGKAPSEGEAKNDLIGAKTVECGESWASEELDGC